MHNFRKLSVWKMGRKITHEVYRLTASFPEKEQFGMTNQMRRAAVSLPVNVAEGCGRESDKDFARFLDIAQGSSYELETLLILSYDFGYIDKESATNLAAQIRAFQVSNAALKKSLKS